MRKILPFLLISFGTLLILNSCRNVIDSDLDKTAKYVRTDSTQHVVLYGYKKLMSHDFTSLFLNEYYLDSIQLSLNSSSKSVSGKDISIENGGYPMAGHVKIKKKQGCCLYFSKK